MRCTRLVLATAILAAATSAKGLTPADVYVYYPFEETSGTVFNDAGPNNVDATFYRPLRTPELPGVDASNVTTTGQFGGAIGLGTRTVSSVSNEVVGRLASGTALPVAGDSFAVSFWLKPTGSWGTGVYAAYKMGSLEWTISYSSGLLGWSSDAAVGSAGSHWGTAISSLSTSAYHHFVMQFSGTSGITALYVDKTSQTDNNTASYHWGNRKNGLCVGGRDLDAANHTAVDGVMDDFAIISGTVTSADVVDLYNNGAAASGLAGRRLVHYAMDETTGTTTLADSSGKGNNAALVGYAATTMYLAPRDISIASEPGKFGKAIKFADGWEENAQMASVTSLPNSGDAFTVAFWYKPDEQCANAEYHTNRSGWDNSGVIATWSANGIGFSIGQNTDDAGSIIVRTTDGGSTSNSKFYTLRVGDTGTGALSLSATDYHHFAVTVDSTRTVTGIYVDGVWYADAGINNGFGITNAGTGVLGARVTSNVNTDCTGYLDDFAVFKGQLSTTDIQDIMARGVAACIPEPSAMILLLGVLLAGCAPRRGR
jgi:hypothetical protein